MDKATLEQALQATDARYQQLAKQKADFDRESVNLNTQMLKLEGEYGGYQKLLDGLNKEKPNAKVRQPAKRTR